MDSLKLDKLRFWHRWQEAITPTRRLLLVGVLLLLLAVVVVTRQTSVLLAPVNPAAGEPVVVNIPPQASTVKIGQMLYEQGLIRNTTFFYIYTKYRKVDYRLQAGEYTLSPQMSLPQIVDKLVRGEVRTYSFTIPEGYTIKQIADLLAQKGFVDREKFLAATKDSYDFDFLDGVSPGENQLEGFLFPSTYQITRGTSEREIVRMMLKRFDQVATPELRAQARERNLSVREWVTLASLIEKEAKVSEERPIIAGVLYNRLRLGMPLQVDATILYALGEHRERVLYRDLEVDSSYNTYRHTGLPPGPIASPGEDSLKAALNPTNHNYLYYVSRNDGTHEFTTSLAEHNVARQRYGYYP
ncbi:MAG: endolytic transglycosylase MltG [Firmicutes bacterium]|nr:endolytic transglycosylase MltG [Bacillota bacterium]